MPKSLAAMALVASAIILTACASTDIQPLTATSFKVATSAASACGRSGARKIANQAAAIEVIKRGGDRFLIVGEQTGGRITGAYYDEFSGTQTVHSSNEQDLVVQMLAPGQRGYNQSLSARELLGAEWQDIVSKGAPDHCV